jgi:putative ABC transport system permease protein
MFRLALRSLRFRWGGFIATFIGMFFCAALMTASGGLLETGLRDAAPPDRVPAAPILVAGDTAYDLPNNPVATLLERVRIDASLVNRIESVPGVTKAVTDVTFPADVLLDNKPLDSATPSYGHGWSSAELLPYALNAGAAPATAGEVVLEATTARQAGVTVGGQVKVALHGTTEDFRVSGIAAPSTAIKQTGVFFSPADVQRLSADPSKVDAIGVFTAPGADVAAVGKQITAAVGGPGVSVLTGDDRGHGENPKTLEVTDLIIIGGLIGGLSMVAGLLGVASTLSLAFQQRHREMALLRAIGTTPRQLRRMILGETIFVSIIATAIGVLPGILVSEFLFKRVVDTGLAVDGIAFHQGWIPAAVAAIVSLGTSIGAAVIAGRRMTKTKPTEALADADGQTHRSGWVRPTLAVVCFAISGFLVYATTSLVTGPLIASPANFASIFLGIGLALLGPSIAKLLTTVLGPVVRSLSGISGYLASLNSRARVTQMAAVITPIMLLVAIGTANLYATTTETSVTGQYTQDLSHNVVLEAGAGGFAPEIVGDVRKIPGVAGASEFVTSAGFIESPKDPWQGKDLGGSQLKGLNAEDASKVSTSPVTAGSFADLKGDTVALTVAQAEAMNVHLGDTISIRMGDRAKLDLKLVALFTAKSSFESIMLPADVLAAHTTIGLPKYLLVTPAPGADSAALNASLGALAAQLPGIRIEDRSALNDAFLHHLGAQALVTLLMVGMLLGYIAIQVINNLSLSTTKRRREFGLQRLTGSTKGQVLRMMSLEGAQAGFLGILLGTLVAPVTLIPFSLARTGTAFPSGSPWMYLGIVAFAGLLALGGTLFPTWLELRSRPLDAAVQT